MQIDGSLSQIDRSFLQIDGSLLQIDRSLLRLKVSLLQIHDTRHSTRAQHLFLDEQIATSFADK